MEGLFYGITGKLLIDCAECTVTGGGTNGKGVILRDKISRRYRIVYFYMWLDFREIIPRV